MGVDTSTYTKATDNVSEMYLWTSLRSHLEQEKLLQ